MAYGQNTLTLSPKRLVSDLVSIWSNPTSPPEFKNVLVTGAPGGGKTALMELAVKKLSEKLGKEVEIIVSHLITAAPEDTKGYPTIVGKETETPSALHIPFGDLQQALSAKVITIWILDDFGQANEPTQCAYMQLLHGRELDGKKLPDCVYFVAATNRREDKANVRGILEPVKSRFQIVELKPSVDDWCEWATGQKHIPVEMVGFMRSRPDALNDFDATADMNQSPSSRQWERAAHTINALGTDHPSLLHWLSGAVGRGRATELIGYYSIFNTCCDPAAIIANPEADEDEEGRPFFHAEAPDRMFATCAALAYMATEENFGKVLRFSERLLEKGLGEYGILLVRDSAKRNPAVTQSVEWNGMISGPIGKAIEAL